MSNIYKSTSEEVFRSVIENGTDLVIITDTDGIVTYVSPQCSDIIGYEEQDILGISMPDFIHPDDKERCHAEWQKVMAGGLTCGFEYRIIDNKGNVRWLSHSAKHIKTNGNIIGMQNILRNITERKTNEIELQKSEKLLSEAQKSANIGSWVWDLKSGIAVWSEQLYKIYGRDPNLGVPPIDSYLESYHPDDIEKLQNAIEAALNKGTSYLVDYRIFRENDGEARWIRSHGKLEKNENGKPDRLIGMAQDITEQKHAEEVLRDSEQRFRALFEGAPQPIIIYDRECVILMINKAGAVNLNCCPDECLGKSLKELLPDVYVYAAKRFHDVIDTGKEMQVEDKVELSTGTRWFWTILQPVCDEYGKAYAVMNISYDITERKKAEEAKSMIEDQLHQSEKMQAIGQLAGGIAHDFNNQLAGIQIFAELIKGCTAENSILSSYAENIQTIVQRSSSLTRQLLAFSRKGKYQEVKVDFHNIINEVISILDRSIDKRIELKKNLKANLHFTIGDPSQLQNAVLNLVLNARDAIENVGEIKINTENTRLKKENIKNQELSINPGDYIKICIQDTGKGMDDKTLSHIFEPFFTTKAPGSGTGMGLAAVYGTIKNHNGCILANSVSGEGTTITIYLPVVEKSEFPLAKGKKSTIRKGKASILFVDDEEMITTSVEIILKVLGYKMHTCKNGKEAVKFYKENWNDIDLVIIDMIMPEMNGKEAFIKMKKINPKINALILSGYSMDEKAREVLDMGVKGFIEKPFTQEVLTEKIADILNK